MRTTFRFPMMLLCVMAAWLIAAGLCDNTFAAEAKNPFVGKPFFDLQKAFFDSPGPAGHWLPTITVAKDGSVLVFKDQRKKGIIEVFRSEDGGKSWLAAIRVGELVAIEGDTFDDGRYTDSHLGKSILGNVIVDETTGDIMVFTTSMKPAEILYRSSDNGKSWKREKIVIKPDKNGWLSCTMASSEPGITLKYGKKKGRLLMPTRVFVGYLNKGKNRKYYTQHYSNALYSDDHGKTWYPSEPFPETGTGESGLVELSDGRIYYNSRTHTRPGNRRIAWSHDGGETWKEHYESKFLPDGPPDVYGCKAGLIRLPLESQDILIYTSPKDKMAKEGLNPHRRDDIMVWASFDGAKTWPVKRLIDGGPGGYTWLAAGRKGTPSEGIIYMLTWNNYLVRFNLAWIMEHYSKTEEPVRPTNKHLLLDNRLIENTQNVRLTSLSGKPSYYNIRDYGAISDGKTINTQAIQKALDDCNKNGGGTIYIPPGDYVTGTLVLRSHTTLHLDKGATLLGSSNLSDYPENIPAFRSFTDNYTSRSLIYAENVKLTTTKPDARDAIVLEDVSDAIINGKVVEGDGEVVLK